MARREEILLDEISAIRLALIAGLPVLVGAWLVLAPAQVFSREMTWDLMLNVSGAWSLAAGQIPHVDYHEPIGTLAFRPTQLGFLLTGPILRAAVVGQLLILIPVFVAATIASARRLAPLPAIIFVVYTSLLVIMPANLGDQPNAYTFAMWYNRWGWSLLTTLCLILFVPPRIARATPWVDAVVAGVLLVMLFSLKITFAATAFAAVALAMVASSHVRAGWRIWIAVSAVVVANAVAPYNWAYWGDVWHGVTSGYTRVSLSDQVRLFIGNQEEYALHGIAVLFLLWLWRRGQASFQVVVLAAGTIALGLFAMSQNAQQGRIPLGIVVACLIYDVLRDEQRKTQQHVTPELVVSLAAVMILPALSLAAVMTTVTGYHRAATRDSTLYRLNETQLAGLSVARDPHQVADALAQVRLPYTLLSTSREPPIREQLTQFQYVQTLEEAAAIFDSGRYGHAKIAVLDQVNPLPFMLGYPPPRGTMLWGRLDAHPRPADEVFADTEVVMIPKYSTNAQITAFALTTYQDYLSTHFPVQEQRPSWTVLSRGARTRVGN